MRRRYSMVLAGVAAIALGGLRAGAQEAKSAGSGPEASGPSRPANEFMRRAWNRMTADDRAALFEAHLAALHVGLKLTTEQEAMWPALDSALKGAASQMEQRGGALAAPAADPVAELRRRAERMGAISDSLRRIADAAQPLYATLNEDQKRRLPLLLHGFGPGPMLGQARGGRHDDKRDALQSEPRIGWGLPE